jgi:hypothetical protein
MVAGSPANILEDMTRRDASWLIARAAAVVGGSAFFEQWLLAAQPAHGMHSAAPLDPHDWAVYRPKFFAQEEYKVLDIFTGILIPSDETPGAREAHVAPFIDFVVNAAAEYAPDMQVRWRRAVQWLLGQDFTRLDAKAQLELVTKMAESEQDRSKKHPGYATYRLIKEMTVHAFYSSRVGLIDVLEYKGLAYLTEFPACTHPEHQRV